MQLNIGSNSNLIWRLGDASDADAIAAMSAESFDPLYQETWSAFQIADILNNSNSFLLIGNIEGQVASFALCRQILDEVELLLCATRPSCRNMGIGRSMLRNVARECWIRGVTRLFLEVRASNVSALSLYSSSGFIEDGRRKNYYRTTVGDLIDAITMSLNISHMGDGILSDK